MPFIPHPKPFLEIRVEIIDETPPLCAACAGYEVGEWRQSRLCSHILEWLPEFALKYSEWVNLTSADAVAKIAKSALAVYQSEKFKRRGEFGEILLHILLRQYVGTIPAISKIYFKDSRNDTVKGFDAVHVREDGDELELWLGEAKFYNDYTAAARDAIEEIKEHTMREYLRAEFVAICNKIDDEWPRGKDLRLMISENVPLDKIFSILCIPVLLTYDSEAINANQAANSKFIEHFKEEVIANWEDFRGKLPEIPIRVHLFLLPLKSKADFVQEMHDHLVSLQSVA